LDETWRDEDGCNGIKWMKSTLMKDHLDERAFREWMKMHKTWMKSKWMPEHKTWMKSSAPGVAER
jgi:hypothetical protein